MTADLDLSPEAVERQLFGQERQDQVSHYDRGRAAGRDEALSEVAPLIRKLSEQTSALASENERLTVEIDRLAAALDEMTRRRDAWREKAAGHDDLRAAVRAGIEQAGDRNLSRVFLRGALAESEQSLAEARAENARLRAERDAAWQAGAEAMREAAASVADDCCKFGESPGAFSERIRDLPLPGRPKEATP